MEKLKLQLEAQNTSSQSGASATSVDSEYPKLELRKLIPSFKPQQDDMGRFLGLFERQLKFLKLPETSWVAYLIGVLPTEVAKLIAREPEEKAQDYEYVKEILL